MFQNLEQVLLIAPAILFLSISAGETGYRFGLPALSLFLGVGMLSGSDGLNTQFSDPSAAQLIGMLVLSIILFSGGMDTKATEIKPIASQGVALATLRVLATTSIMGGFTYRLSGLFGKYATLTFPESLLLTAVMSSTDSTSVFSILRSKGAYLKERLCPTLELRGGGSGPVAYMLILFLVAYIQNGGMNIQEVGLSLVTQLSAGVIAGFLSGKLATLAVNEIDIGNEFLYPILLLATASFTLAVTTLCEGNSYLAVHVTGLVVDNAKIIHKKNMGTLFGDFAWLWQIMTFLTLGLLVSPHELLPMTGVSIMVEVLMILIIRLISVFPCLMPYKDFSLKDKLYISWVGLRGAVSIIFITCSMIARIEHVDMFFNIMFFITILSSLIQRTTVTQAAKWLDIANEPERKDEFSIELPEEIKSAMSEINIILAVLSRGNRLMQLTLPDHTLAAMVKREGRCFISKGNTGLEENGKLLMTSDNDETFLQACDSLGVKDYTTRKG